jgi:hypothetical protein
MTVLSPDTLTYGDDPNGDPGSEWPSLLTDHPGPARNAEVVVKWTKRARTASDLVHELRRARFIADSVPLGPTLLETPFQLLMAEGHTEIPARRHRQPVGDTGISSGAPILTIGVCLSASCTPEPEARPQGMPFIYGCRAHETVCLAVLLGARSQPRPSAEWSSPQTR